MNRLRRCRSSVLPGCAGALRAVLGATPILALLPAAATAQVAYQASCTNGEVTRTVEVRDSPDDVLVCDVYYSKPDEGDVSVALWYAENERGYCAGKYEEFIDKLRSLGWECSFVPRTTSEARTSER